MSFFLDSADKSTMYLCVFLNFVFIILFLLSFVINKKIIDCFQDEKTKNVLKKQNFVYAITFFVRIAY